MPAELYAPSSRAHDDPPEFDAPFHDRDIIVRVVIPAGIEPATYRLGICRSILLSYGTSREDT
jgi:hypothetical protein